jgi:hypothetical protein
VIRRRTSALALAALLPLASLTAASCATFDTQRVASVNDHELDGDDLQEIVESQLGQLIVQSAPIDGEIDGSSVRAALTLWIVLTAIDDAGLITAEMKTEANRIIHYNLSAPPPPAPQLVKDIALLLTSAQSGIQAGVLTQDAVAQAAADADISVDSVYGTWDDEVTSVVPMG